MISNYPNYFRTMPMAPEPEPEMPEFDCSNEIRQRPTPSSPQMPSTSPFEMAPGSPVQQDTNYTQGYLRTQIGKKVRVTYLLGTGTLQDRTGILDTVGISYIIIKNTETNTRELGDIYSVKFVTIFD